MLALDLQLTHMPHVTGTGLTSCARLGHASHVAPILGPVLHVAPVQGQSGMPPPCLLDPVPMETASHMMSALAIPGCALHVFIPASPGWVVHAAQVLEQVP